MSPSHAGAGALILAVAGAAYGVGALAGSTPAADDDWPQNGRTVEQAHYSPLAQINPATVQRLSLAWSLDLDVTNSITEPIEVGGVLYLAAGYSIVHAIDVRSGRLLWRYDPHVPQAAGKKLRVGWGIRGLTYGEQRLFVATHDGRLLALDPASGHLLWSVQTLDSHNGAFISGVPRVFRGKVVIGNGGDDFSALRGYVTAYDTNTGRQLWRFYVVPGKPGTTDHAASDPAMAMAAKTWTGQWWKLGGGGSVWNAMTYDPDFNRLYIGTGNGSPMNWKIRSPGGGDNLFVASIVALNADTGQYVWHYQTTPGDTWDYDSATDITLVTLTIDGRPTKVLLQAAKNGFFYVIDRASGHLLSAEKLGKVTWAERIDLQTGRPVLAPGARDLKGELLWPSFEGLHHWLPQAYSESTGLMYEPTVEMPVPYSDQGVDKKSWKPMIGTPEFSGLTIGNADVPKNGGHSVLVAWDPAHQRRIWQIDTPGISNGGLLATGGNLVFEGLADGYLHAYSADRGQDLWSFFAGVAPTGVPITYQVDGRQYLSVTAGPLNGSSAAFGSASAQWGWQDHVQPRRLLTFALDAKGTLPATPPPQPVKPLIAPEFQIDSDKAKQGSYEFLRCLLCHGTAAVAGGNAPDLRASSVPLSFDAFAAVVRGGTLIKRGMPAFPELSDAQLNSIRHYLRARARQ
ncbi:MAG TPA: PQQ-dependent dehydrogenase, methanol/ethanol family [Steroidobacteraceae bacterium]